MIVKANVRLFPEFYVIFKKYLLSCIMGFKDITLADPQCTHMITYNSVSSNSDNTRLCYWRFIQFSRPVFGSGWAGGGRFSHGPFSELGGPNYIKCQSGRTLSLQPISEANLSGWFSELCGTNYTKFRTKHRTLIVGFKIRLVFRYFTPVRNPSTSKLTRWSKIEALFTGCKN